MNSLKQLSFADWAELLSHSVYSAKLRSVKKKSFTFHSFQFSIKKDIFPQKFSSNSEDFVKELLVNFLD